MSIDFKECLTTVYTGEGFILVPWRTASSERDSMIAAISGYDSVAKAVFQLSPDQYIIGSPRILLTGGGDDSVEIVVISDIESDALSSFEAYMVAIRSAIDKMDTE